MISSVKQRSLVKFNQKSNYLLVSAFLLVILVPVVSAKFQISQIPDYLRQLRQKKVWSKIVTNSLNEVESLDENGICYASWKEDGSFCRQQSLQSHIQSVTNRKMREVRATVKSIRKYLVALNNAKNEFMEKTEGIRKEFDFVMTKEEEQS